MGKHKKRRHSDSEDESSSDSSEDERKKSSKKKYDSDSDEDRRKKKKHKKKSKKKQRERSPSADSEDSRRRDRKESGGHHDAGASSKSKSWKLEETEDEKAARKAAKEAKKIASLFGYTNHTNPFGDSNLHEQFVWRKKEMKDGGASRSKGEEGARRLKLVQEITKVRQRRDEREKELEEMERLKNEEARIREAALYDDWEKKEEEFHLEQAKVRTKIRLVEGREKPIDLLAKNILLFGEEKDERGQVKYKGKTVLDLSALEAELREPYLIFKDLNVHELKELQQDIREYQTLEGEGPNKEFWDSLALVCKDELKRAGLIAAGTGGVHSAVTHELDEMFDGKSVRELEKLRVEIQRKVDHNDGTVDVDYWENVLLELKVYHAKAVLREIHTRMLQCQLQRLEERKADIARKRFERAQRGEPSDDEEEDGRQASIVPAPENVGPGYDESSSAMAMVNAERNKGLGRDEDTLGQADEVDVDKVYSWLDKYRPRKPRYFNRVKTGWDWNKYNQTHYDHDNPPPKTIQGYKFNIFYPDLIDKTQTPTFRLEPADNDDFCIIRFMAGPPYEDVAFKIFNREWERSHKRGFKCLFERGILHLYFNFKRARYRR